MHFPRLSTKAVTVDLKVSFALKPRLRTMRELDNPRRCLGDVMAKLYIEGGMAM